MIPLEAQLLLHPSDVLLNCLIATGFSGAITKTHFISCSFAAKRILMSNNNDNMSQYFMFNFITYSVMTSSWIPQRKWTTS